MAAAIRRLGPGDEPLLAQLASEAPLFDLEGRSAPEAQLPTDQAASYLTDPSVLHWVAEEEAEGAADAAAVDAAHGGASGAYPAPLVVGEILCHVLRMPSGDGRELLLYAIGVRDGHRRRGIGRALIAEMRRWMEEADVRLAWVLADNPGAEAFYTACGFGRAPENEQGVLLTLSPSAESPASAR